MTMMMIDCVAEFEIQRRAPSEFNMAQIWHECQLALESNRVEWSDLKELHVLTTDVSYKIVVKFSVMSDVSNWRGFYGKGVKDQLKELRNEP